MMPWVTWVLVTGVTALGSMSLAVLVYTITWVTELTGVIRVTGASGVRVTWVAWVWVNMVTNLIILKLSKNEERMHVFSFSLFFSANADPSLYLVSRECGLHLFWTLC